MIARIKGEVVEVHPTGSLVVDVSGVGYELKVSAIDLEHVSKGQTVQFSTYFHVRENSQELFAFSDPEAKHLFEQLIGVNGVGPKGAMSIMGLGERTQIQNAIASENIAYISGASGVGKKVAERICVDLKDKVGVFGEFATVSQKSDDALDALVALGFAKGQAAQVLSALDSELSTEDKVKRALKELT
jgi:Holliday junction DNA helicase RuvA